MTRRNNLDLGDATCWFCTGEACARCLNPSTANPCEHDVIERHGDQPCVDVIERHGDQPCVDLDEPDEPDFGWCDYYLGVGICTFGCRDEPACQTDHPREGWAIDRDGFDALWTLSFAYWWALQHMVYGAKKQAEWAELRRFMQRSS